MVLLIAAVIFVNETLKPNSIETAAVVEVFFVLFLFVFYFLFRDSLKNQSVGRRLLKQKVINIYTGETLTRLESFKRNIFFFIPYSPIFEFFKAAGDPQKRRFGDRFACSVVVRNSYRK